MLIIKVVAARNLDNKDWKGKSDPYCSIKFAKDVGLIIKTKTKDEDLDPFWDELFENELQLTDD